MDHRAFLLKVFVVGGLAAAAMMFFGLVPVGFVLSVMASDAGPHWWSGPLVLLAVTIPAVASVGLLLLALWLAQRPEHHAKAALDIAFGYVVATILLGPANMMDFI